MSLNDTPGANRAHIAFFGTRNAGKSSVVNALTGQNMSVVSAVPGTTTDPVTKSMEILPLGPVVIIDTPGFDDEGELGAMRVQTARRTLARTDAAVLVVDGGAGLGAADRALIGLFHERAIPFFIVWNKADLPARTAPEGVIAVSAKTGAGIARLKERLGECVLEPAQGRGLFEGLIGRGDCVLLVTPIDESAPKGRMILPQQQALRDVLDRDGICLVTKETELARALETMPEAPKLVVTDSQAFSFVSGIVPADIPLTSFSILMARAKGTLESAIEGVKRIDALDDGDRVLMAEGCTHHRQCGDIGTVKIPDWLRAHTGKRLVFETCSGLDYPQELSRYRLIVHCGGCMLNAREMRDRARAAREAGVPMVNYGILIAQLHGILARSVAALEL